MKTFAVVTGSSTGIGAALAIDLANKGFDVLAIARSEHDLQTLKKNNPEKIHIVAADVGTLDDRLKIKNALPNNCKIKFLVHNAAISLPTDLLENISLEDWRYNMAVNLEAPLFLTQMLLPFLKDGRILHLSTGAAYRAVTPFGCYCITKAALLMLTKVLKDELKTYNIAVGSAMPGVVDTKSQQIARSLNVEKFPIAKMFQQLKAENKLAAPKETASFLSWLLIETNTSQFEEKDWDYMQWRAKP